MGDAPGLSCRFVVQDHKSRSRILSGKATGGLSKTASSKHHPVWHKTQSLGHRALPNPQQPVLCRGISAVSRLKPNYVGITPKNLFGDSFLNQLLAKVLFGNKDGEESLMALREVISVLHLGTSQSSSSVPLTQSISPRFTQLLLFKPVK